MLCDVIAQVIQVAVEKLHPELSGKWKHQRQSQYESQAGLGILMKVQ